ncbi:hypothetical protein EJB05_31170 [Eragrostis curvula]|uniref:ABC transporter domain-containing protein n=1 Tax=Eragrostis curvula TaxID=38414 RepID=A0A5J9UCP8_9POAL|nr:hypothetical protein EJB05_31170 [Eragrostis curvula]
MWAAEAAFSRSGSWRETEDEADALRWAALQRLPTVARARRGLLRSPAPHGAAAAAEGDDVLCEVDVAGLSSGDRTALVDRLLADSGDAEHFFRRIRSRFDAVHIEFPKIEVRYEDLTVDAYVHVGSRALPTIPNFICNMTEAFLRHLRIYRGGRVKLPILDNISGIIRPSRMTLLLGPPSSGKTTLLLALAGRLGPGLKMSGDIAYNGHRLNEFVPQRTSAYVSQQDWHASEMTVRETLEFAGRCQGVGIKYDMLVELLRREKNAGIKPDEDLDVFMKALALDGKQTSLVAEYIMKILGLDVCADTIVGDEMIKGISGGQKKRLTTAHLLLLVALITMTVFFRTTMHHDSVDDGIIYLGALYFAIVMILFNGFTEVSMLVTKLPVLYKHRDLHFYPPWAFTLPSWLLSIPTSLIESGMWQFGNQNITLGEVILTGYGLFKEKYWFWIGVGALFGYAIALNILFTLFLTLLNPIGNLQAVVSKDEIRHRDSRRKNDRVALELRSYLHSHSLNGPNLKEQKGMVLPFQPLNMCFKNINYYVDVPELLFMKRGGQLIYAGPLGSKSRNLVEFFEVRQTKDMVDALSKPNNESKELTFATKYAQPFCAQYIACLWKQNLSYWRNPQYTAVRFFYTVIISLMFGTICWKFGSRRETQHDIFNAMGAMYAAVLFIGITNATSVQPVISIERFVSYRERAAGMYSALPFAFSLVTVEFPYILVQSLIYGTIFYSLGSFEWTAAKFLWFLYFMYFTLLYFTFYGMMTTAITPNHTVAPIIAAPFYTLWNLFSGFMIPRKRIPVWWRWYYWANPVSWTLYGLLTSQFGDLDQPLLLADGVSSTTVATFLEQHFGFRHDFLGVVAAMVAGFCVLFAVVFALAIKCLNFQRR